jgi:bacterioferritin
VQAKEGVLDRVNAVLTNELTMINQYFLHAEMCHNWGYDRLYRQFRAHSMEEMRDVEHLVEHILYLDGFPNLQRLGTVRVGETTLEHLQVDLQSEMQAVDTLREAIGHCATVGDFATRRLLEEMITGEESQIDWLETQLETVRQIGIERYLGQQIRGDD